MDKWFTVRLQTSSCSTLFAKMIVASLFLRQKTQDRVLGRGAGVPCEVASGLRSHSTTMKPNWQKSFLKEKEKMECLSLREVPGVSGLREIGWIER